MPLTFPKPNPSLEQAEHPRVGELPRALQGAADHAAAAALPPIFEGHDPADSSMGPDTGVAVNDVVEPTLNHPQPTEPSTLPPAAGSVEPVKQTE